MKSRWVGLVFVFIFSILFAWRQYKPDTWLMGWDSLHPEFNYQLAFSRSFNGVWRESQGVGAVAVHSHMTELPRIVTLWIIDLFVPTSAVRWTYVLLMLVLGTVGIYVLLVHILARMRRNMGMVLVTLTAIVGTLAYIFNLSTLHHFLVPFEMFVVMFGLLPWSLWSVARYFEMPSKGQLVTLTVIQLLLSSTAFAATLWIVYYGVWLLTTWAMTGKKRIKWVKVQAVTLLTNAYWLLPTVYGLLITGNAVASAKINEVFSPEAWLNNVAYGTPGLVLTLKSFILQWMSWERGNGKFDLVTKQWVESGDGRYVETILVIVAGLVVVGLIRWIYLAFTQRNSEVKKFCGLVMAGVLLFTIMLSQVWPISVGIEWARERLPLVGELLRTPFTKVSIPLQLVYAVLISIGLLWVVERVRFVILRVVVLLIVAGVIVYPFGSWVTKGNLMGEVVVTKMPSEYLSIFDKLKSLGDGRMVPMPVTNMWGWEYRDWWNGDGYEGANFTQFGIPQSLLIRDFDRWSTYNEGFFNEFSTALYGGVSEVIGNVLEKYDVRYVLLDESVIAPGQDKGILRIEEAKKLASELGWEQKFNEGFLTVWETPYWRADKFVSAPAEYTNVSGDTTKTRNDVIYEEMGTYVSENSEYSENSERGIIFPFADLMREEVGGIEYRNQGTVISTTVPSDTATRDLVIPGWEVGEIVRVDYKDGEAIPAYYVNPPSPSASDGRGGEPGPIFLGKEKPKEGESYFYARVSEGEEWEEYRKNSKFKIQSSKIEIVFFGEPVVYDFAKQGQGSIGNCDVLKRGRADKSGSTYMADGRGAVCDYVVMDEPFTRVPHLMRVVGENKAGRSLKFFLYNTGSERNDIEYLMNKGKFDLTFSLLPWDWDGHYSLNIETRSFGQYAENRVDKVEVRYVPLEKIARAKLVGSDQEVVSYENKLEITHVKKTGTWLYGLGVRGEGLIRLSQGYDEGWVGIKIQNSKFKIQKLEHVKVDGWSNGWILRPAQDKLKGETQIVILFYWPQLLQYLGFVILLVTGVGLMTKRRAKS